MARLNFVDKFFNAGPLILLYYLSISEIDSNLENFLGFVIIDTHNIRRLTQLLRPVHTR